jgi:DNA-binding NtrC family response regulator
MNQGKILAIDDEANIRHLIENEFKLEDFQVATAPSGEEGLRMFEEQPFDVVLLDLKLPKISGLETLKQLKKKSPGVEVIMITGYGDIQSAVESIKLGARDFITKPFKLAELLLLVRTAIQDRDARKEFLSPPRADGAEGNDRFLMCPSPQMQEVYSLVDKIALSEGTILIEGETGTGKDVLAYFIHKKSHRRAGPFVTLDCGLLTHNLAESELYGHRKGAFSGAADAKIGLVEKSDGGTLFLDEIGNIDLEIQKKFLRFLETGFIRRVGENREIHVNSRVMLATNLPMEEALKQGKIRTDLFYRMAVFNVSLPPLRNRPQDILPLAKHFLARCSRSGRPKELSAEAAEALTLYAWPGNVRELKSTITKLEVLVSEQTIRGEHLPVHLTMKSQLVPQLPRTLEDVEKEHILKILEQTGGNQMKASQVLGINRKTLYKKIKKYNIFT